MFWMLRSKLATVVLGAVVAMMAAGADDVGKIMRPVDGAALPSGAIDIIATAPAGHLEIDGVAIPAEQPFPGVFQAVTNTLAGEHTVSVVWADGRKDIRVFVGSNAPAPFKEFRTHPPVKQVQCTQCHGVSSRGRFRFQGGCFACHAEGDFTKVHPHPVHVLEQCGICHNAHGSTEKSLLLYPKEQACKLCHG